MAFTATIQSITPSPDGSGNGINLNVCVVFADSVTGFTQTKSYTFPLSTTQATAVATITADGQTMKTALATIGNLQAKVGSIITI